MNARKTTKGSKSKPIPFDEVVKRLLGTPPPASARRKVKPKTKNKLYRAGGQKGGDGGG